MKNKVKVLAFDLDDTLTKSKSPITLQMSKLLQKLIKSGFLICIVTGGKFNQVKKQVIDHLPTIYMNKIIIFPLSGAQIFEYKNRRFVKQKLVNDISKSEYLKILNAIKHYCLELNIWCNKPVGKIVENRGAQITFSALGQKANYKSKLTWSEKNLKNKLLLKKKLQKDFPNLSIRLGGLTSIDISDKKISKEFAINSLMKKLKLKKQEIVYFGDNFSKSGNDLPVVKTGVIIKKVRSPNDTYQKLLDYLK